MFAIGSCYQARASEDVTVDTSVCLIVNCKVWSCAVRKSPINPINNSKPIYSHARAHYSINLAFAQRG
jgi:hypothetical protein